MPLWPFCGTLPPESAPSEKECTRRAHNLDGVNGYEVRDPQIAANGAPVHQWK